MRLLCQCILIIMLSPSSAPLKVSLDIKTHESKGCSVLNRPMLNLMISVPWQMLPSMSIGMRLPTSAAMPGTASSGRKYQV